MSTDHRFREVIGKYGGKAGAPSRALLKWLQTHSLSEQAIGVVSGCVLTKSAGVGALSFYSEKGVLETNAKGFVPIAIRDGLLIVGSCPNGDPVAIDVRERLGEVGYICHETMWQASSVREVFLAVAPTLGELVEALVAGNAPRDYYEAVERRETGKKTS